MTARGRDITAHSVCEVQYDGGWHLIDSSVMNYFVKDDGKLASVDEIHDAIRAWFAASPEHQKIAGVDSELRKFAKNGGWKNGPPLLAKAEKFYGKDGVNDAGWHGWPSTMQEYYKIREPAEYTVTTSEFDEVKARLAAIENKHKLNDEKDGKKPTLRRTSSTDKNGTDDKAGKGDDDGRPTLKRRPDDN